MPVGRPPSLPDAVEESGASMLSPAATSLSDKARWDAAAFCMFQKQGDTASCFPLTAYMEGKHDFGDAADSGCYASALFVL